MRKHQRPHEEIVCTGDRLLLGTPNGTHAHTRWLLPAWHSNTMRQLYCYCCPQFASRLIRALYSLVWSQHADAARIQQVGHADRNGSPRPSQVSGGKSHGVRGSKKWARRVLRVACLPCHGRCGRGKKTWLGARASEPAARHARSSDRAARPTTVVTPSWLLFGWHARSRTRKTLMPR